MWQDPEPFIPPTQPAGVRLIPPTLPPAPPGTGTPPPFPPSSSPNPEGGDGSPFAPRVIALVERFASIHLSLSSLPFFTEEPELRQEVLAVAAQTAGWLSTELRELALEIRAAGKPDPWSMASLREQVDRFAAEGECRRRLDQLMRRYGNCSPTEQSDLPIRHWLLQSRYDSTRAKRFGNGDHLAFVLETIAELLTEPARAGDAPVLDNLFRDYLMLCSAFLTVTSYQGPGEVRFLL
jgi:hypothetical protein